MIAPSPVMPGPARARQPGDKGGFSLLEVLVACGVLVIGLASVAAMLPAATSRLQEAAAADRGGSMAAAALADFECRDLAFRGLFLDALGTYLPANRAVVFGEVLPSVSGISGSPTVVSLSAAASGQLKAKIDTTSGPAGRGFFLEDELQYQQGTGSTLLNVFTNGVRDFRRGACWGAMVEPYPWGSNPATTRAVRATIAVFRKPGGRERMLLAGSAGGVFIKNVSVDDAGTVTPLVDATDSRRFLGPCAPVLAVAQSGTEAPRWLTVNSSWPQWVAGADPQATPPTSYGVVFREAGPVYQPLMSSGTLQVIGFENIQSVTQQTFTIE
jgi:hypothetical protein